MLVVYAGLLARYEQMDLLERLRDKIGRRDGIPGLWLLVPGDHHALIDGKAVPVLSPGQRDRIPESWLENKHRANGSDQRWRSAVRMGAVSGQRSAVRWKENHEKLPRAACMAKSASTYIECIRGEPWLSAQRAVRIDLPNPPCSVLGGGEYRGRVWSRWEQ